MKSGWTSGITQPLEILDPEKARAEALAWFDGWLDNREAEIPPVEETLSRAALLTEEQYAQRRRRLSKQLDIAAADLNKFVSKRRPREDEELSPSIEFKNCEPWPEPVNGNELLSRVAATFRRFIIFKHVLDAVVMALWALGSHLYEEFNIFPRLGLTSPLPECGKTTGLDVLEHLTLRATRSDNLTTAVAFRVMETYHPSLLLDELDTFLRENPELVGVLNSGHKKGGRVSHR